MTTDAFTAARPRLLGIAYRMLGSVAEAEDVVGDVAERWAAADQASIAAPEGWLVTVTTRRALDVLRAARLRRVDYPGEWLPEPVATDGDPTIDVERRETLTMGFLLLLERLTPIERAVLVLHDVLDHPYDLVAAAVGRSEDACRQAVHRARRHVTVPSRRPPAARRRAEEVAHHFMAVGLGGDVDALVASLAPEIAVSSDGGGVVHAGMRSVTGARRCARYLRNLAGRAGPDPLYVPCELNGEPGVLMHVADGWAAMVVTVDDEDRISVARIVANPAKLERLVATLVPSSAGRPGPWEAPGRFRHRGGQKV